MNKFIIGFIFIIRTSRFFSESLHITPKATDLIDLAIIPLLGFIALSRGTPRGVNMELHGRISRYIGIYFGICIMSALVNVERVFIGPIMLFIFGMLEGPLLFVILNKVVRDKKKFGEQMGRFLSLMVLIEAGTVIFFSYPLFLATGNPDKMSGTFGNNAYQFSAFLIIMGGFFLGRQLVSTKSMTYNLAIQGFIFMTFILLQFRAAVPAFFFSYGVLAVLIYGRKIIRMVSMVSVIGLIGYYAFAWVSEKNFNLRYEELITLAENPEVLLDYGKVKSYINTASMFGDYPLTIPFGCGPGAFVSRANNTFTVEVWFASRSEKGVGNIITSIFGDEDFSSDMQKQYIFPLMMLGTLFGSTQVNNPNSSVLAALAETGIIGFTVFALLYGTMVKRSVRFLRFALKHRDPVLLPLAGALVNGSIYLLCITPLDNYLEIARVTLPMWTLFWTVSTLVHNKRVEQMTQAMEMQHYQYLPQQAAVQ
jgi:hypothetical protein